MFLWFQFLNSSQTTGIGCSPPTTRTLLSSLSNIKHWVSPMIQLHIAKPSVQYGACTSPQTGIQDFQEVFRPDFSLNFTPDLTVVWKISWQLQDRRAGSHHSVEMHWVSFKRCLGCLGAFPRTELTEKTKLKGASLKKSFPLMHLERASCLVWKTKDFSHFCLLAREQNKPRKSQFQGTVTSMTY